MKRLVLILLALLCLLGSFTVYAAVSQNYCDVFGENMSFFLLQSSDAESGKGFSSEVVVYHTLRYMDTAAYAGGESGLTLTIPQKVFEAEAMKHFDVDAAHLRTLQIENENIYNADTETYVLTEFAGGGFEQAYAVRGYTVDGGRYTVYYSLVEYGYEPSDDAVLGEDYILGKDGTAVKLVGEQVKASIGYSGKERKFYSWVKLDALPDLSGMTVPTEKDTSADATTRAGKTTSSTATKGSGRTTAEDETEVTTTKQKQGAATTTTTSRTTVKNGRVTTTGNGAAVLRTTIPTVPMETLFERDGVVMKAVADTFPKGTVLSALPLDNKALDENARWSLSNVADLYTVYDLTAAYGGNAIQPKGKVSVTFAIPEGYEPSRTAVVYIGEGGAAEVLVSKVDRVSGTVTADLSHFSTYVIAQLYTANVAGGPDVWSVLGTVFVLAAAAVVAVFFHLRRRAAKQDEQETISAENEEQAPAE